MAHPAGEPLDERPALRDPRSPTPTFVGIDIGAVSVKIVTLCGSEVHHRVLSHQGRPQDVIDRELAGEDPEAPRHVGVVGHLGHISEVAALQRALQELDQDFDAVVSLGGEALLVYILSARRATLVLSHNKCAAGSGEFLVQQVGRMGLTLDAAIERSRFGKVTPLASRCSVHCKSDITHKLNRQEASIEDVVYTLHDGLADKVISLLEKGGRDLHRILAIGGMTRNEAMLAALRRKLPGCEIAVVPESPYLEAWGAALLTRDEPLHTRAQLRPAATLERLPPLERYRDRVSVLTAPPRPAAGTEPLVLGVDAGSTTTKAVLVDRTTSGVVASHYLRTQGDPIAATKRCLTALRDEVGDRPVGLIGTTGSARELVGAFLGTRHVYNEISAQAAGAAHFDPGVDTLFEIGGQDSKYVYLQNGVPVDYAMNAACSAGTGSFLEESAQGDLGIPVSEIAAMALRAISPVKFKATCAAFINSDIRIALQEGSSREDIAAGLVYAIAENYLSKVKGPRFVGERVFLQGGVALNRAIGHAFAHNLGREILIPPMPELIGAHGVTLLAHQRSDGAAAEGVILASLLRPEMRRLGRFTCRACLLFCGIERFEVAGRRFPFGGRCSLFERVWQKRERVVAAPDLVEERARIMMAPPPSLGGNGARVIGIPRALTTHSLLPLYRTFLSRLGLDVVLSEVDSRGDLRAHSGFCLPAQIAHGAVADLVARGVELVFFPHVVRMPNPRGAPDSVLCPVTQASPYVLAHAFPGTRFLAPRLDFTAGYEAGNGLVTMAIEDLGVPRDLAEEAHRAAVSAQAAAESAIRGLGREALARAIAGDEPAIVLLGRSYNAFTPEASQSIGKKLASQGILAIPADCLEATVPGATSWHYPNTITNAVEHVRRHPNLFLLYVSNFSCTIDSFTQALLFSELGSKPYLMLEIDAHTADAGIQTRIEAFLDIVRSYRQSRAQPAAAFTPARLGPAGRVTTSSGAELAIDDPRVRIHFPAFSDYHDEACAMAARWLGLHSAPGLRLDRAQLERGLRHTSGRECLPLPICVGQLLQIAEMRKPGEVAGMFMLRGGAPCVVDSFLGYFERFIARQQMPDLFVFAPHEDNDYCGFDLATLTRSFAPALYVADILVEIEQCLQVVGAPGSIDAVRAGWRELMAAATTRDLFHAHLGGFIDELCQIRRTRDPATCPRVVVTGDFFTRFSDFFMEGVRERYARRGVILKPVDLEELVIYTIYDKLASTAQGWGLQPGYRAAIRACTQIFQRDGQEYLSRWKQYQTVKISEQMYRRKFEKTGLLVAPGNDISMSFERAARHVSPAIFGEVIPTVGKGLQAAEEGYDGIILLGPFNCLPYRISESILKPICYEQGMPILACESDGYAVSPGFLRQVDVHIQQVLDRQRQRAGPRAAPPPRART